MRFLKNLFVIPMTFLLFSCSTQGSAEDMNISGRLEGGLRFLPVEKGNTNLDYTVYRGDYIVFDFIEMGEYELEIPSLDIDTIMPRPEGEKPYVKIKETGEHSFTLGQKSGTITVLSLAEPNYREISAQEAADLLANTDPFLLDVRTSGEYDEAHISGSNLIPVQILSENLELLEKYKNEDILIYCRSGNRSTVASKILLDAGFTNIINLRYGITDWIKKDLPVE